MVVSNEGVENQGEDTTDQDRVDLLAKAADHLKVFNEAIGEPDMGLEPDDEPVDESVDEPTDEPVDESVDEPVDDEPTDEPEDEPEGEPGAVKPDEGEPTLPAAYHRSLIASEWTEEEITQGMATHPAGMLTLAEKIHRTRNAQTAQFADAGRRARETAAASASVAEAPQADAGLMMPVNVDELVEKYGNEEVIRALSTPVNAAIEQINRMLPEIQKSAATAKRTQADALNTQVETFFTSDGLKPYGKVYGVESDAPLTEDQKKNRIRVLEDADAICAGASLQGRQFSVGEAMMMAHDSIAKDFQAELIRKDIKTKTKTRAKGVSLRPTGRKSRGGSDGKPSTRKQLEQKVGVGLQAAFNK